MIHRILNYLFHCFCDSPIPAPFRKKKTFSYKYILQGEGYDRSFFKNRSSVIIDRVWQRIGGNEGRIQGQNIADILSRL